MEDNSTRQEDITLEREDNTFRPEDNTLEWEDNTFDLEDTADVQNELYQKQKDRNKSSGDSISSSQDIIKTSGRELTELKDIRNIKEENTKLTEDNIKVKESNREGNLSSPKLAGDNTKAVDDIINLDDDTTNEVLSRLIYKRYNANSKEDTLKLNQSTEFSTKDSIKVSRKREEHKKLMKKIEEDIINSLRRKYPRQMIRRWASLIIYISIKEKVKSHELKSIFKISTSTLMRDTTLFKNKGWIKFTGHKKNGYYRITEEGATFAGIG